MDEMNTIYQAVATLGYPIVVSFWLLYISERDKKRNAEQLKEITNIVSNNTQVIQTLCEKIESLKSIVS